MFVRSLAGEAAAAYVGGTVASALAVGLAPVLGPEIIPIVTSVSDFLIPKIGKWLGKKAGAIGARAADQMIVDKMIQPGLKSVFSELLTAVSVGSSRRMLPPTRPPTRRPTRRPTTRCCSKCTRHDYPYTCQSMSCTDNTGYCVSSGSYNVPTDSHHRCAGSTRYQAGCFLESTQRCNPRC